MDELHIVANEGGLLGYAGPVLFSLWRGRPEITLLNAHFKVATRLCAEHGTFAMLLHIAPGSLPPGPDERKLIKSFYRRHAGVMFGLAQVVRGEGFIRSAVRAVMATSLMGLDFPAKVFHEERPAVAWLAACRDPVAAHKLEGPLSNALEAALAAHRVWTPPPSLRPRWPRKGSAM
jgi:hypothetical protein